MCKPSVPEPAFNRPARIYLYDNCPRLESDGGKRAFQKGDIRFHKYFLITFIKVGAPPLWPPDSGRPPPPNRARPRSGRTGRTGMMARIHQQQQ